MAEFIDPAFVPQPPPGQYTVHTEARFMNDHKPPALSPYGQEVFGDSMRRAAEERPRAVLTNAVLRRRNEFIAKDDTAQVERYGFSWYNLVLEGDVRDIDGVLIDHIVTSCIVFYHVDEASRSGWVVTKNSSLYRFKLGESALRALDEQNSCSSRPLSV